MKKLSIITINRNNANGLLKTIKSVISQTFTDFEYIIIDGASTDNSVDIIREYADKITYWISEPDKGIYNAMNKGILEASSEYLLFLNSGDWLACNNMTAEFENCVIKDSIIAGDCWLIDNYENKILYQSKDKSELNYEHFHHWGSTPHQATFIKKALFKKYGYYNESYKILADTEFIFRMIIINNVTYNHWKFTVSYFDTTGVSHNKKFEHITSKEREKIFENNLPLVYISFNKLYSEIQELKSIEREFLQLKNGKLSLIIRFILWIKKIIK